MSREALWNEHIVGDGNIPGLMHGFQIYLRGHGTWGALALAEADAAQDVPQPCGLEHRYQLPVTVAPHRVKVVPHRPLHCACFRELQPALSHIANTSLETRPRQIIWLNRQGQS